MSIFKGIRISLVPPPQYPNYPGKYLPEKLHTFEFLPKFLRSLEPYDQILTGWSCGQKCTAADPEAQPVVKDIKPSNVGALNTTFTMLDEKVY